MNAVRCPSPQCGRIWHVQPDRLGRSMRCPACDVRMTARPLGVDRQLRRQEERLRGGAGAAVDRLPLVAVIDNVRSLWNVGSMFRTADACGVVRMYLAGITGTPPRAEIAKTALGAERAVAWEYRAEAADAVRDARDAGFVPVALETGPGASCLTTFRWPRKVCIVVGNEVAGLAPAVAELCDARVQIPMRGVKESLNVAVAFGIATFAASRGLEALAAGIAARATGSGC